jgi:hypothetical protein
MWHRETLCIVDSLILGRALQKPVWKHGLDSADPGWIMGFYNYGLESSGFRGSRDINGSVDRPTNMCYHLHCDTELTDKSCRRCGGTFTPVYFIAPYQVTSFINLRPVIFHLTPFGRRPSLRPTPAFSITYCGNIIFWFTPFLSTFTFSGTSTRA